MLVKDMAWIFRFCLIFFFAAGSVRAQSEFPLPEFTFVKTFSSNQPVVNRSSVYDMGAAAMLDGEKIKIWNCGEQTVNGQPMGNDAIVYTELNPQTLQTTRQPSIVINRSFTYPRLDNYLCQPSVVKHDSPMVDPDGTGPIAQGSELYLMYFECSYLWQNKCDGSLKSHNCDPAVYSSLSQCQNANNSPYRSCTSGASQFGPAQICLAASTDGINWAMYNNKLWEKDFSHYAFNHPNTEPTPVVPVSQPIKNSCGIEDGQPYLYSNYDKCSQLANNYGSGMPTARVEVFPNGGKQIWLYYTDTQGDWNNRKIYRLTSWDGFNFDSKLQTNIVDSTDIKLYSKTPVMGHSRFYLAGGAAGSNMFGYSFDSINFTYPNYDKAWLYARYTEGVTGDFPTQARAWEIISPFKVGAARPDDLCLTPAPPGIVGDKYGNIDSLDDIIYLSGEGKYGNQQLGQTPGSCYSEQETQRVGSTWDIYAVRGKLVERTLGDLNYDGLVSLSDLNTLLPNIGQKKCYVGSDQNQDCAADIFDYNLVATNYGVNKAD